MISQLGVVSFLDMISNAGVITGIILTILGVVLAIISVRLTRAIRKADNYNPDDKLVIVFKVIGLVLVLVGFITMAVSSFNIQ